MPTTHYTTTAVVTIIDNPAYMLSEKQTKLALGQINTARNLIGKIAKDYVKLLKYADSLYRCKTLKVAALGRMSTVT